MAKPCLAGKSNPTLALYGLKPEEAGRRKERKLQFSLHLFSREGHFTSGGGYMWKGKAFPRSDQF